MNIFQKIQDNLSTEVIRKTFSMIALVFLFSSTFVFATDNATLEQQKTDALNNKSQATAQKNSLISQVAEFDNQINSIQAEINKTQATLDKLQQEIANTNSRIEELKIELDKKKIIMGEYIRQMYIEGQASQVQLILTSNHFSDFVDKSQYLSTMSDGVRNASEELIKTKDELDKSKERLLNDESTALTLKDQQLSQQGSVESQRSAKDSLLAATKGDETKYNDMIKNIQKEIDANNAATWNTGSYVSQGRVNKGDVIGYIGNSGYSTGSHLHFEIRDTGGSTVNPQNYIGNGFIDPAPSVAMNVPYGYSPEYFPGVFHSGIDKADGGKGTAIMAAADGDIVKRVTGRPNTYPWSYEYGNFVMIRHDNGMVSLYGHMR